MANQKRIVLLHGWGTKREKLTPLSNELKKRGWQVFVPKLPGFDSPPPQKIWGVNEYGEYILKQTQKLYGAKNFFLLGHSFGGRIAIKLGKNNNKKLSGLVLCSPSGLSRSNPLKRSFFWLLAKTGKILLVMPPVAKIWRKLLYKLAGEYDYEKTGGIMREIFKKVISEDLKPAVKEIKIPVLIIWGKKDRVTPISDAYFLKQTLSGARLVVFDQEGHQLPYQQPKKIAKEIDRWGQSLN